jgi:hypothetical protein
MSNLVFGIVSIYDHVELLPHFLDHYGRIGVREMFLSVRNEQVRPQAEEYVKELGFGCVFYAPTDVFDDSDKVDIEERILAAQKLDQDDYILHLDLDEFHQYPAALSEIVAEMNYHNDWAVAGLMADHVAADGRLRTVTRNPSIWEQFPIIIDLSANVLLACTTKIMICRKRVRLKGGGRHSTENVPSDRKPIPGDYIVHHFKWLEGLDDRIKHRLKCDTLVGLYRDECLRFLDFYKRCGGNFDLSDQNLNARTLFHPQTTISHKLVLTEDRQAGQSNRGQ